MMTASPNPYNPLQPVDDPALFVGREDVFAFFRQHFVGTPHDRALALIGRRGLGKSSVLRQLRLDEQYVLCIVSLGALELPSESVLIAALVEEIQQTLEQAGASTYRLPDWPEDGDLRAWFKADYLEVALSALRIRHLLLILDDAHLLLDAMDRGALPDDTLRYLGELLSDYDRLDFVLALDAAYEDRILTIDLLNDPTLHIRLAELAYDEAERLVIEPADEIVRYEDGVVERILAWAGGHPFLLHSICRLLFRRSEERNHSGPITENDLNAVHDAVLDQADEIFGPLWARATQNERHTLEIMAELCETELEVYIEFETIYDRLTRIGYMISRTQLAAALRSLSYEGLVRAFENLYTLPAELIGMWVAANATIAPPKPAVQAEVIVPRPPATSRRTPLLGLLVVLLIVAMLGAAALAGVFDADDDPGSAPVVIGSPTSTLSLNLEATRQSDILTQTEDARPTITPSPTNTPTASATSTDTPTATITASPAPTERPTATSTARPSRTPATTSTRTPIPIPTNTPRPTVLPTLDPGR